MLRKITGLIVGLLLWTVSSAQEYALIYDSIKTNFYFQSFEKLNSNLRAPQKSKERLNQWKNLHIKKIGSWGEEYFDQSLDFIYKNPVKSIYALKNFNEIENFLVAELKKRGLSEEWASLAISLSLMNPEYTTIRGTAGIWQLYFHHARAFRLELNSLIDERRNNQKATLAALDYIKYLQQIYENEPDKMILAYIASPLEVNKAIRKAGGSFDIDHYGPYLPSWLKELWGHYWAWTFILQSEKKEWNKIPSKPVYKETVVFKPDTIMYFEDIAKVLNMPVQQLFALNPEYYAGMVNRHMKMNFPKEYWPEFQQLKDSIVELRKIKLQQQQKPEEESSVVEHHVKEHVVYYKVKSGDNLGRIAALYDVSVREIMRWNNLRSTNIYPGQKLKIITSKKENYKDASQYKKEKDLEKKYDESDNSSSNQEDSEGWITYIVQPGDNLYNIAKKFPGISAENIMEINGINENIYPGQVLKIKKIK
ncbi:MAG: hypothetical protein KatS3mg034_0870 [Vicingaceae bacterium]|nr:MAG: hypothetical protein KatS3mg034_0870 [Vicingaceae bacterium]